MADAAPICPYCGNPATLWEDSSQLYQNRVDYGPAWVCQPCDAWVGCHDGTHIPLGRLANSWLRLHKMLAHRFFDPLWQAKMRRDGCSKKKARGAAYKWLAAQLGIPPAECHIGAFDAEMCERVVEICRPIVHRMGIAVRR